MARHKQVRIQANGQRGTVDAGMAPLLKAVWKCDIFTVMSCQENHPGISWICFWFIEDLQKFLSILHNDPSEYFVEKILSPANHFLHVAYENKFHFKMGLYSHGNEKMLRYNFNVRFPKKDMKRMVKAFDDYRLAEKRKQPII